MKLVILTCDKYKWIVPIFNYFMQKYWPDNPYETEVVTDLGFMNGKVFYAGNKSWASRLIEYLCQSKEEKFLITLEDYLIKSLVDTARVKAAEKLCEGDVGYVRLSNGPYKYFTKHCRRNPDIEGFREYPLEQRFSVVAHMGFFQKQFLLDVLRDGEDVWHTENNGTKRLSKMKSKWRVLWPETDIVDYMVNGGLMKKGRLRTHSLNWTLAHFKTELLKQEGIERGLYESLQERMAK